MSRTYVVFDRSSGRLVGASAHYDAGDDSYREQSADEVLQRMAETVDDSGSTELDVVETDVPLEALANGLRVDVARRQLIPQARLRLHADRTELEGDGQDAVELEIALLGEGGDVDVTFSGEVRVETTRGRLSARGGRLTLDRGIGRLRLTSAPETVNRVIVRVADPACLAAPAALTMAFL